MSKIIFFKLIIGSHTKVYIFIKHFIQRMHDWKCQELITCIQPCHNSLLTTTMFTDKKKMRQECQAWQKSEKCVLPKFFQQTGLYRLKPY